MLVVIVARQKGTSNNISACKQSGSENANDVQQFRVLVAASINTMLCGHVAYCLCSHEAFGPIVYAVSCEEHFGTSAL